MHFMRGSRSHLSLTHLMLPPLAACISLSLAGTAHAELPPQIPRDALFPKPAAMQSIIGHSYGGYSALAALALTPDLFACGAASSTVADLVAFAGAFPKTPANAWVLDVLGDVQDAADVAALRGVSPLTFADRVTKPVLIARGDQDGISPAGIDAFVAQLNARGVEAASIVYKGDGHFFRRENQLDYFARVEALFARCLGGRSQPMEGDRPTAR